MIPTLCTINVIEEKDELIVTALAPLYDASKVSRIQIETHHIENYLKENNYSHGKCIQGAKIFNRAPNTLDTGPSWVMSILRLVLPYMIFARTSWLKRLMAAMRYTLPANLKIE